MTRCTPRLLMGAFLTLAAAATLIPAAALAANLGPFWHVNGAKLGQGVSKAIKGNLVVPNGGTFYAEAGNKKIEIRCEKTPGTGKIWNGTQHGEGEGVVQFEGNCKVFEIVGTSQVEIKECQLKEPITAEAAGSLWFLTSQSGATTIRTSKIVGVVNPTQKGGKVFAKVTISGTGCGALEGVFSIEGNGAAKPLNGENEEVDVLKGMTPTEQIKHVWQPTSQQLVESQLELKFNAKEAKLVGEAQVELSSKEEFGVFTE